MFEILDVLLINGNVGTNHWEHENTSLVNEKISMVGHMIGNMGTHLNKFQYSLAFKVHL